MNLTAEQLKACCLTEKGKKACMEFLPHLNKYLAAHEINTLNRVAAFLGQVIHESGEFTRLEENLNYGADALARVWPSRFRGLDGEPNIKATMVARNPQAIGNAVYANRMGNGTEESGEGYKYRGRGLIQLTGKMNLQAFGKAAKIDFVANPDLLAKPEHATQSACWFWSSHGLNSHADSWNAMEITKRINGGTIGFEERKIAMERAKRALQVALEATT